MSRLSNLFKTRVMEGKRCGYINRIYIPHVAHICITAGKPKCKYCGIGKNFNFTGENLEDSWEALDEQNP